MAGGLLLTGCGEKEEVPLSEPEPEQEQGSPLLLRTLTRTDGATQFADPNCSVRAYLTEASTVVQDGLFEYTGAVWTSNLSVKEERQYYLYGYMPSSIEGSFAAPASPATATGASPPRSRSSQSG